MTDLTSGSVGPSTHTFQAPYSGTSNGSDTLSAYDPWSYWRTRGAETPSFYKRLRAGELLPINAYSTRKIEVSQPKGDKTYYYACGTSNRTDYYQPEPVSSWIGPEMTYGIDVIDAPDLIEDPKVELVLQQAAARLAMSQHDTLTFLAELHKLRDLWSGAATRLIDLIGRRGWKRSSNAWLEGRYGWRQLYFDAVDISAAIESFNASRAISSERFGITDSDSGSSTRDIVIGTSNDLIYWTVPCLTTWQSEIGYRGLASSKFEAPAFGFNPITTAWELIPLSFVVDWIVGVGTALHVLSGRVLNPDAQYGYGLLRRCDWQTNYGLSFTDHFAGVDCKYHLQSLSCNFTGMASEKTRQGRTPSLIPQLNVRISDFQVVDLLALIVQRVRSR